LTKKQWLLVWAYVSFAAIAVASMLHAILLMVMH
jgi:uncharacterized membrane protein